MDFKNEQNFSHLHFFTHDMGGKRNKRYLYILSFLNLIYLFKLFAHILMLAIAGRTAGPD